LRIDRIVRRQDRQIAARLPRYRLQQEFRRVFRVALNPAQGKRIVSVDLRCIPPRGAGVAIGLGSAAQVLPIAVCKLAGWRILGHIALVDLVAGTAPKFLDLFGRERRRNAVYKLAFASHLHELRRIVTLLHVREPVMGHELNPGGGKDIEKWRRLVVAVS